jgi:hypothetical protein
VPSSAALLKAPRASGTRHELLAEHVVRFRVDFAPGGRFPGLRDGPANPWPTDPFGFRQHRALVRVELETASPGAPGSRGPARSQTLVLAPRNLGL